MKRFFSFGLLAGTALLFLGASPAAAQAPRLAYFSTDQVLAGIPTAARALEEFQTALRAFQVRADSLGREFQTQQQAFAAGAATMTAEARQQREGQLRQTLQTYQQQLEPLEQAAEQRKEALDLVVQPFLQRLPQVVEQIRAEQGYAMIFSVGESGLVAADPSLDISEVVRQRLQAAPPAQ